MTTRDELIALLLLANYHQLHFFFFYVASEDLLVMPCLLHVRPTQVSQRQCKPLNEHFFFSSINFSPVSFQRCGHGRRRPVCLARPFTSSNYLVFLFFSCGSEWVGGAGVVLGVGVGATCTPLAT